MLTTKQIQLKRIEQNIQIAEGIGKFVMQKYTKFDIDLIIITILATIY